MMTKRYRFAKQKTKYTLKEIVKKATSQKQKRGDSSGISIFKDGSLTEDDFSITKKYPYIFISSQDMSESTMWQQTPWQKRIRETKQFWADILKRNKRLSKLPVGKWSDEDLRLLFWEITGDLINRNELMADDGRALQYIWASLHNPLDFNIPSEYSTECGWPGNPKDLLFGQGVPYSFIYSQTDKYIQSALKYLSKENPYYKKILALKGTNVPLQKARKVLKELMYVEGNVPEEYQKTYLTDNEKKKLRKAISKIKPNIYEYPGVVKGRSISDKARIGIEMSVLDAILPVLPIPSEPQAQEQAEEWRNDYQIHIENEVINPAIESSGSVSSFFDVIVLCNVLKYLAKRRAHHKIPFKKMNKNTWSWPAKRAGKKGERTYFIKKEDFGSGLYHPQLGKVKALYKVSYRDGLSGSLEREGMWTDFKYLRDAKAYVLRRALEEIFHHGMPRLKRKKK